MNCNYCGKELVNKAKYCLYCGMKAGASEDDGNTAADTPTESEAAQEAENAVTIPPGQDGAYCPHCGGRNDKDAIFCCHCGKLMKADALVSLSAPTDAKTTTAPGKISKRTAAIIGGIAVVAAIWIAVWNYIGGDQDVPGIADNQLTYIKENGLFTIDMMSVESEPVKIDTDVTDYQFAGRRVFYKTNDTGNLYLYDLEEKTKLGSDIDTFMIDENEQYIMWQTASGEETYDLYYQDIAIESDAVKLASGIELMDYSPDLAVIYYIKNGTLYRIQDFSAAEKIASDAADLAGVDTAGGVYYTKSVDKGGKAIDYIKDDMASADASIEIPSEADYQIEVIEKTDSGYVKKKAQDEEAYQAALEKYYMKQERDKLRAILEDYELNDSYQEIYYYNGSESSLLDKGYKGNIPCNSGDILVYTRMEIDEPEKVKISKIELDADLKDIFSPKNGEQTLVIAEKGNKTVEEQNTFSFEDSHAYLESEKVYLVARDHDSASKTGTLIAAILAEKGRGSVETVAKDVLQLGVVIGDDIYYIKGDKDSTLSGDLYCNEQLIDNDVYIHQVEQIADTNHIVYGVDFNQNKEKYMLKQYNGESQEKIADDVHEYQCLGEDKIAVLVDYNTEQYTGDLKLYTGTDKLENLDMDVMYLTAAE